MIIATSSSICSSIHTTRERSADKKKPHFSSLANPDTRPADISLVDCADNMLILLVVEDKHLADEEPENVTAQLVAEAVAAFRESNVNRISAGLQPISNRVSRVNFFF